MMAAKKNLRLITQALEELTDQIEAHPDPLAFPLHSARIDYLPAELILPDPAQARRVLPESIHVAFHSQQMTPVQALHELVRIAQMSARQKGRPFTSIAELISASSGDALEDSDEPHYTPEEQLIRDLVTLAVTIRDDGQVNPLTVVDVSQGVSRLFRIETGERRYWASWLLREFLPGYTGDGTVPCIILKPNQASVFRQARENTARAGLSAIAMARQAALLLIEVHGIPKPDYAVTNAFYRQALALDLRDKREYTDEILAAMGGITKGRLYQYKALLRLSDEAIELADRYQLDEYRLRDVVGLPMEDQAEMVRQIIQFNLTAKQVKELCTHSDNTNDESGSPDLPKEARQLARLLRNLGNASGESFARALISQDKDVRIAQARIQTMKLLLSEIEEYLSNH